MVLKPFNWNALTDMIISLRAENSIACELADVTLLLQKICKYNIYTFASFNSFQHTKYFDQIDQILCELVTLSFLYSHLWS